MNTLVTSDAPEGSCDRVGARFYSCERELVAVTVGEKKREAANKLHRRAAVCSKETPSFPILVCGFYLRCDPGDSSGVWRSFLQALGARLDVVSFL